MRPLPILTVLLLLFSCAGKTPKVDNSPGLTEEQKRKIYTDSFALTDKNFPDRRDSTKDFEAFMDIYYPDLKAKNKYDPFIYALEEIYVDTTRIDTTRRWFRLTVVPSFRSHYCLIVEKHGDKSFLTTKVSTGNGGYYTGTLAVQMKFQQPDTLYNNLLHDLERLGFWRMPLHDTTCGPGFDGETWTFELLEGGKYRLIERWLPESCGSNTTRQLAQVGLKIKELSRLDKVLAALGEQKSGM